MLTLVADMSETMMMIGALSVCVIILAVGCLLTVMFVMRRGQQPTVSSTGDTAMLDRFLLMSQQLMTTAIRTVSEVTTGRVAPAPAAPVAAPEVPAPAAEVPAPAPQPEPEAVVLNASQPAASVAPKPR